MGKSQSKSGEYRVQTAASVKEADQDQPTVSASPGNTSTPPSQPQSLPPGSSRTDSSVDSDMSPLSPPTVEAVVAKVGDLHNGQMKEVEVANKKILLIKDNDQFYAVGNKCTHYGAPLSKGTYCQGKVRCPWHGACFDVTTGDIEDFPGLDSLPKFEVVVKGDEVIVKADSSGLQVVKRVKPMVKKCKDNKQTAVLVGGGPSCVVCAQTLREEGFTGRVVIVSKETHLPYDRVKLSKAMNIQAKDIALRNQEFYDSNNIELILGTEVTAIDTPNSSISLSGGQTLGYNHLLLATGGKPRRLSIPGADLDNVYVLRTPEDAEAISGSAKDKRVVIVGTSFIALEVASYFNGKAESVDVIGRSAPLTPHLGAWVGSQITKLHESKGVNFHLDTSVKEFVGSDGNVKDAILESGASLPADVVVMGVGVVPATDFLTDSGLGMTKAGYVSVNKRMETNIEYVYAAGDIVEFPLSLEADKAVNIQHFQMAHKHGRTAALSMVGKPEDINSVPYFWTVQYGKSIRYCGYGAGYDDVVIEADSESGDAFVAFYIREDRVVAAASLGRDPIVSKMADLMGQGHTISKEDIHTAPIASWLDGFATGK